MGSAAFLDEEAFGVVSLQTQYSVTIIAQEKRIGRLLSDLAAAKHLEQARRPATAALGRSLPALPASPRAP